MKLLLLLLAFPIIGFGQNVNIPDVNFKKYLVGNKEINTNGDKEIQVSEASAFNGAIFCNYLNISNLKGIEAFTTLTSLGCWNNQLTSLDVSKNTALTDLICGSNQLTSLDVSKNTALTSLWCAENKLISLDVSKNTALTDLSCYDNQLSSLDVSKNTLDWLYCDGNKFDCAALISKYGIENLERE
jgi:Leucine-rich repeat (LRR) protein